MNLPLETILHWDWTKMELEADNSPKKIATRPIEKDKKKKRTIGKTRAKINRNSIYFKLFLVDWVWEWGIWTESIREINGN